MSEIVVKYCRFGGVAKGSSISWVAKLKGDENSEFKLSNGRSRSYREMKLLLSAGKWVVAKLEGYKSASQSSMELYYPRISGPLCVSWKLSWLFLLSPPFRLPFPNNISRPSSWGRKSLEDWNIASENTKAPKRSFQKRTTPILKKRSRSEKGHSRSNCRNSGAFSEQLSEWHSRPNLCENPILGATLGATLWIGWTPKF